MEQSSILGQGFPAGATLACNRDGRDDLPGRVDLRRAAQIHQRAPQAVFLTLCGFSSAGMMDTAHHHNVGLFSCPNLRDAGAGLSL
jgi:hypothetical protein